MKLVAKQIDVIAGFINREKPHPYRFRYKNEDGDEVVIRIEKVLSVEEQRIPGVKTFVYECQSTRGMLLYRYQIMYKPDSHSWLLYKI